MEFDFSHGHSLTASLEEERMPMLSGEQVGLKG